MPRRVVLVTYGSFGDLHPFLAVALGLRARGHDVVLATTANYREKVESEGIPFAALPPDLWKVASDPQSRARAMHPRTGTEYIIRQLFLPHIEEGYRVLLDLCTPDDLIVAQTLAFQVPLVAEKLGLRWLAASLQPSIFLSAYDPPVLPAAPWANHWPGGGPGRRVLNEILKLGCRHWFWSIDRLRRREGLSRAKLHPLLEPWSPHGNLALFSPVLGAPQPDWPARTTVTGFPLYDKWDAGAEGLEPALERFLQAGPPPVIFTLGTSGVLDPGVFYEESLAAVRELGVRAVLLVGPDVPPALANVSDEQVYVGTYAPYSALLPRGALTVHQGGIGTTQQALRAARPMIVVPFSHDQPDNAARIQRLGVGAVVPRSKYRRARVVAALRAVLADDNMRARAAELGRAVCAENGVVTACDIIERN